jgi:hypothetical protein
MISLMPSLFQAYTLQEAASPRQPIPDQVHALLELALRYRNCAQHGQQLAVHALTSAALKQASSNCSEQR